MNTIREEADMPHSEESCCCQKPENLKGTPEECSEEQIRECHGEEQEHSCCQSGEHKES